MSRIPSEIVEQIYSTARIEEVIGEFVQLKRSGSNLKGLSPFNNERSPSFMVSPAKQIFKDFSSGKGGNVVTFLMELEQLSFPEALRWLARKYNIEIPEARPQTPEEIEASNLKEAIFLISDLAAKWYQEQLVDTDEGKTIGLSYFHERGFTDETIATFGLGYSPRKADAFSSWALGKGYSETSLIESGIGLKNERGWVDRFRGRVMFPIYSISGRILGFGGRVLEQNAKTAKYLNSPENPIYSKSNVLYGLYQARQAIVKADEAFLVEGYTDVISFHQSGVKNVVSSSGTSLTEGQIAMLRRYTDNITLLFDGDAAGLRASFRGLDMMLEQGVNVRIVQFPDGEDPDSFAQSHSQEELVTFLAEQRKDFISFKTDVLLAEAAGDPLRKAEVIRSVVESISKVPNGIGRDVFVREAARLLGMDEVPLFEELERVLGKVRREERRREEGQPKMQVLPEQLVEVLPHGYAQEKNLMELLVKLGAKDMVDEDFDPDEARAISVAEWVVDELETDQITFMHPMFERLHQELKSALDEGFVPDESWWVYRSDPEEIAFVTQALAEKYSLADWKRKDIHLPKETSTRIPLVQETTMSLKLVVVERKIKEIEERIVEFQDTEGVDYYLDELTKWLQVRTRAKAGLNRQI